MKGRILVMERRGAARQVALRREFNLGLTQLRGGAPTEEEKETREQQGRVAELHTNLPDSVWLKHASYGPHAQAIFWDTTKYTCNEIRKQTLKPRLNQDQIQKNAGIVAAQLQPKPEERGGGTASFWVVCTHLSSGNSQEVQEERAEEILVLRAFMETLKERDHNIPIILGMDSNCDILHRNQTKAQTRPVTVQDDLLTPLRMHNYTTGMDMEEGKEFLSVVKMRGIGTNQPYKIGGLELHTIDCLASTWAPTTIVNDTLLKEYKFKTTTIKKAKQIMDPEKKDTKDATGEDTDISDITAKMLPNYKPPVECMSDHLPIAVQFGPDVRVCQWNLLAEELANDGFLAPSPTAQLQLFEDMKKLRQQSNAFYENKGNTTQQSAMKAIMQHMATQAKASSKNQFKLTEFEKAEEKDQYLRKTGVKQKDIRKFKAALLWGEQTKDDFKRWEEEYLRTIKDNDDRFTVFDKEKGRDLMDGMIKDLIEKKIGIFTFQEMDGMRYKTFTSAAPDFACTLGNVSECGTLGPFESCNMSAGTFYARKYTAGARRWCSIM